MHQTLLFFVCALALTAPLPIAAQVRGSGFGVRDSGFGVQRSDMSPNGALPAALRTHLEAERFQIVTSIRGLPLGIREELQRMWGTPSLDIADPGADFQATAEATNPRLPTRRLIAAGCSADHHCLVYYERGGSARTSLVALFGWTPAETRFEWGGTAPAGLKTIADVQRASLAGAIKDNKGLW